MMKNKLKKDYVVIDISNHKNILFSGTYYDCEEYIETSEELFPTFEIIHKDEVDDFIKELEE